MSYIDIGILSVSPSVCNFPVLDEKRLNILS